MMSLMLCLMLLTGTGQAGSSSIQGYVYDDAGQALEGAEVIVQESGLNSLTDETGWYSIEVEPGIYEITADIPGGMHATGSDVVVMENEPTRLDLTLQPAGGCDGHPDVPLTVAGCDILCPIPLGLRTEDRPEELVGTGMGVVDNGARVGSIKFLGLSSVSTMEAPVEEHLHMRGGRRGEILYMVDGTVLREPVYNTFPGSVPLSSIRRLESSSGVYDARYGNFLSGVVSMETPEGGHEYAGQISLEGNDWHSLGLAEAGTWGGTSEGYPYYSGWKCSEVSPFRESVLEFSGNVGGPEPLTTYLLPGIGIEIPGDMRIYMDGQYLETGGGRNDRYGYGFDEWEDTYKGFLKLSYRPGETTGIDVTTSFLERSSGWFGVGAYWRWSRYEYPTVNYFTGDTLALGGDILYALPVREWSNRNLGARIRQEFGEFTSVDLGFGQQKYEYRHRILNDPESSDPMRQTEWLGEDWSWEDWEDYVPGIYTDSDGFIRGGTCRFPWMETRNTTNSIDLNAETTVWDVHDFSWGLQADFYDAFNYTVVVDTEGAGGSVRQNTFSAEPLSGGIFLQDDIGFEDGMRITLGTRLDYFDANYDRAPDPLQVPPPPTLQNQVLDWIQAPPKYSLNPRVSFLMPLSPRQSMHAAFGMYSQVPSFDQLYHMEDNIFSSSTPFGGNPDLELQKTTMYELGFNHSFSEWISLGLTGYFKEMSNLVETDIFTQQSVGQYAQYVSTGSGESRGLELSFKGTGVGFLSWDVGYTLSRATGSSSLPLQNYFYAIHDYQNGDQEQYLDWDQRHTVNLGLAMEVPRGRGLRIGGVPVFGGMDVGFQWQFGSGFPYTHYDQNQFVDVNTMRYPATNSADLKISKRFWLESFSMDLWCEVTNLFDRRNVVDIQDIAWYLAYLQMGGDDDEDKDPKGPFQNPYAFSMQRMVRFGLGLNW